MVCNLQRYMKQRNLNIAQLSREIGISQTTIRGYVQNRFNRIDCEIAIKICSYFETTFGEMFEIVVTNQSQAA